MAGAAGEFALESSTYGMFPTYGSLSNEVPVPGMCYSVGDGEQACFYLVDSMRCGVN
jgi:hypothetical protein